MFRRHINVSSRALVLAAALLWPAAALAVDCVAQPSRSPRLSDCLSDPSNTLIELADGVHRIARTTIDRPMTLRAQTPGAAAIAHRTLLEPIVIGSGELLDAYLLFRIDTEAGSVAFEDVHVRPALGTSTLDLSTNLVLGRVFEVDRGELVLRGVSLSASGGPISDDLEFLRPPSGVGSTVLPGGMLVLVRGSGRVVLEDVTVDRIHAPRMRGAAVHVAGELAEAEIRGSSLIRNVISRLGAVSASANGRIWVREHAGEAPVFRHLRSDFGGALYGQGARLQIDAGLFEANGHPRDVAPPSSTNEESCGGAILVASDSVLSVGNVLFLGNQADLGGSICASNTKMTVDGATFEGGRARRGGAIWVQGTTSLSSEVEIKDSTFDDNRIGLARSVEAEEDEHAIEPLGGALYAAFADVSIEGSTFQRNGEIEALHGRGGAVALLSGVLSVDDSSFSNNQALFGGALHSQDSRVALAFVTLQGNGGLGRTERGGALLVQAGDLELRHSEVLENEARRGGAIWHSEGKRLEVTETTVSGNQAEEAGGLWTDSSSAELSRATFQGNIAHSGAAGHLAMERGQDGELPDLQIQDSAFVSGEALRGGAVELREVQAVLSGVRFEDNTATGEQGRGGAIFALGRSVIELDEVSFLGNAAGRGGAIDVAREGLLTAVDVRFERNRATDLGGALNLPSGPPHQIVRGLFCHNTSSQAEAIWLAGDPDLADDHVPVVVRNSLFVSVDERSPPLLSLERAGLELRHSALVGSAGPTVLASTSSLALADTLLLWGGSELLPPLELDGDATISVDGGLAWPHPDRPLAQTSAGETLELELMREHPHLRGALRPTGGPPACSLEALHPRPFSPLLLDGWPAVEGDPVLGIFGGPHAFTEDWRTDLDEDGVPALFDCDDEDPSVGAWLVQYVDNDGDGVGGALWEGDDCELQEGNVLIGGDCDDDDPDRIDNCDEEAPCLDDDPDCEEPTGEVVLFYGAKCSGCQAGRGVLPWGGLLALLALARVRRRRAQVSDGR
ncbi:MAG: hypothetical protein EA397_02835 [Deltaproteobacteria bacterium]|nr:MAG: hypothetical protein EA397_02835 [Deltaproteobacteria bacterium]